MEKWWRHMMTDCIDNEAVIRLPIKNHPSKIINWMRHRRDKHLYQKKRQVVPIPAAVSKHQFWIINFSIHLKKTLKI